MNAQTKQDLALLQAFGAFVVTPPEELPYPDDMEWEAELAGDRWLVYASAFKETALENPPENRILMQMAYGCKKPDSKQRGGFGYANLSEDAFGATVTDAVDALRVEVVKRCGWEAMEGFRKAFHFCPLCNSFIPEQF